MKNDMEQSERILGAVGYIGWNGEARRYDMFVLSNTGDAQRYDGWWVGDDLVMAGMELRGGRPTLERTVLQVKDGVIASVVSHRMTGAAEPERVFEALYDRAPR